MPNDRFEGPASTKQDSKASVKPVVWAVMIAITMGLAIGVSLLASMSSENVTVTKDFTWLVTVFGALFTAGSTYIVLVAERNKKAHAKEQEERIEKAESKAAAQPEKAKFAWDLARVKLEAYFDRNLSQVNQIFYFALGVMFVGFVFIIWAARLSIGQPKITPTSIVASVAGIISQFIGATFMLIYRSTMAQANSFMHVLERINTVGMSIQILDSVPEGDLKNDTRAEMISVLLNTNTRFRPHHHESKITRKKASHREE